MVKRKYSKDVMHYFHDLHGIGEGRLRTLEHEYEDLARVRAMLEHNPYDMMDIDGIGFKIADAVAKTFDIGDSDPRRIRAMFMATLAELCDASTMVTQQGLIDGVYGKDGVRHRLGYFVNDDECMDLLQTQLQSLINDGKIATVFDEDADDYRNDQRYLQFTSVYEQEHAIIKNMHRLSCSSESINGWEKYWQDAVEDLQDAKSSDDKQFVLTSAQLQAARSLFEHRFSLVTGAAGSGKTAVIQLIVLLADRLGVPYVLCAPTNQAAQRMEQSCNDDEGLELDVKAYTIHRALGIYSDGPNQAFSRAELVICDEASMIDTELASKLFKACGHDHRGAPHKRLLLAGDINQLPSVGPGAVFKDLLNNNDIPKSQKTVLRGVHRQSNDSPILSAANNVLVGKTPYAQGVRYVECGYKCVVDAIDDFVVPIMDREGLSWTDPDKSIAFLSPMKKENVFASTARLNGYLRKIFNPKCDVGDNDLIPRVGDFVMQKRNVHHDDYVGYIPFVDEHDEVFIRNGDRGIIEGVDDTEHERKYLVHFLVDDVVVRYTQQEVYDYLELAYATTVHKSQGSQYDTVVLVMTSNMFPDLLNRNLLYTGLTRARRRLILIGNRNMFDMAARVPARERMTGLQLL